MLSSEYLYAKKTKKNNKNSKEKKKKESPKIPFLYWYTWTKVDNLGNVAKIFSVKPEQIKAWNKEQGFPFKPGTRIIIYAPNKVYRTLKQKYIVPSKMEFDEIAKNIKTSSENIKKWNPKLKSPVKSGISVTYYRKIGYDESRAEGTPSNGKLIGGVQLPERKGWYIRRTPEQEYGTESTIRLIIAAFSRYRNKIEKTPPILIGHISNKEGGYLSPHQSHQNGLDVDIGYVPNSSKPLDGFVEMNEKNMDIEKTWHLIFSFLKGGRVQYIFMKDSLQKLLYEHAREKEKVSKSYLDKIFQYPNGNSEAIIKHTSGHGNHFHVRFLP